MSVRRIERWVCDCCGRTGAINSMTWIKSVSDYGNMTHACGRHECQKWFVKFVNDNGLPYPSKNKTESTS